MELPSDLKYAIETELSNKSIRRIANRATGLSDRYRECKKADGKSFLNSKEDAKAYAAFRMPATFAAAYFAMKQIQECLPQWNPQTLLDTGAGPGTIMWAASSVWPTLQHMTLLEREESMIALGKKLAGYSSPPPIQNAVWRKMDITDLLQSSANTTKMNTGDTDTYDIVTASYVLGELRESNRESYIKSLWEATRGILLLIEPGTPAGFARIRLAREQLMASDAAILAPCPCNISCPMTGGNWCHFSQRVSRSRLHKQVKSAEAPYEDEKFSFVTASRLEGYPIQGHPQVRKGHIILECCTSEGLITKTVTRKEKEKYRIAKDLIWGSAVPPDVLENNILDKGTCICLRRR